MTSWAVGPDDTALRLPGGRLWAGATVVNVISWAAGPGDTYRSPAAQRWTLGWVRPSWAAGPDDAVLRLPGGGHDWR